MAVIEVTDLRKVYGDRTVVDGVSLSVEPGEIFGILGPNGAGKTTTVECIGGLRQRDGGKITVAGMDPANEGTAFREVLDINLNGENSYPVADVLAARGVPFFFSTGYNKDSIPHGYRDFPMLQKPYDATRLAAILAHLLISKSPL